MSALLAAIALGLALSACGPSGKGPAEAPRAMAEASRAIAEAPRAMAEASRAIAEAPLAMAELEVRKADGASIGTLRKLDSFPLYELRYRAPYNLDELLEIHAVASSRAHGRAVSAEAAFELSVPACTCFAARDSSGHRVFGRNFDWESHTVLVLFTYPPEGYASVSLVDLHYLGYSRSAPPEDNPDALAEAWAIPFDGMNEAGLAVGMMAVSHAEGVADRAARGESDDGPASARPTISELGIMRLLLDRAANLDEAIAILERYDLVFDGPPLHYLVADRSGASAVVEYAGGELLLFKGEGSWQVSTNFLFGEVDSAQRSAACPRFALASSRLGSAGGRLGSDGAFGLLEAVSQPHTQWSSVYDQDSGELELAIGRDYHRRFRWPPIGAATERAHG